MKIEKGWAFPDADEFMASEIKADGTYQAAHLYAAMAHVKDFQIAVDGGAHVGTWSRLLAGFFGRVVACEPSPDTAEALEANMRTFACANVEIRRVALGATVGTVDMAPLDPRAEAMKNTGARFVQPGNSIPVERIDDWNLPACGFIKLDVEGSEVAALRGALETLRRCRPIVLYENKGFWRRFSEVKNAPAMLLTAAGYRLIEVAGKDVIWCPA